MLIQRGYAAITKHRAIHHSSNSAHWSIKERRFPNRR
jgi:hypothetical protein